MKQYNKLLQKQIGRHFKDINNLSEELHGFLKSVNATYEEFDKDRELLEQSLNKRSEELLEANLEIKKLPEVIFIIEYNGKILECKGGSDSDLIFPREEYIEKNILDIPDETIKKSFEQCIENIIKNKKIGKTEYKLMINGNDRYFEANFLDLETTKIMIVIEDITERRFAENKLRESEERYRSIVEHTSDVVFETTYEGVFTYLSPSCYDVVGFRQEELIGKSIFELVHPDDLASAIKEFSNCIQEMRMGRLEVRSKDKDGNWVWFDTIGKPYITASNEIKAVITAHDISQQKKREEEEVASQKLESLSVLAGGIAHNFNNLLTIIISNLAIAEMHLEGNSKVLEILSTAQKASLNASDLTNQLKTFAKGSSMRREKTSLNKFLEDSVKFALTGSNITCKSKLTDDVIIDIDKGQISQVINNLIINAKQAMPNGGEIEILTEMINVGNDNILSLENGNYIKIDIVDNGVGIKKENINKIFDPYYSTKERGSGLGLATSYSIIQKHEGLITVDSKLGRGSIFSIYLPCKDENFNNSKDNKIIRELHSIYGSGRILLMDDEDEIRKSLSFIFKELGYEIDCVKDGKEALKAYKSAINTNKPYNAVILDLIIPGGMGGLETVKKLKELNSEVFCIVSSGYSDDPIVEKYNECGFNACLNKPYSIDQLKEILNSINQ